MSPLRDRILLVASNLFQTKGINSTGVDAIVSVANTTKMTLYKYFHTKEELILEVIRKSQQDFQDWLSKKLNANNNPEEKIQKLFDFIEEWVESPSFHGIAFIKASAEFPDENNPVHRLSALQSTEFKNYIVQLAHEANIQDANGLGLQLSILFEGTMQAEQMQRGSGAIKYAKAAAKLLIDNAKRV